MRAKSLILPGLCLCFATWAGAQTAQPAQSAQSAQSAESPSLEQGSVENRLKTLASIQPGLGVIMREIGARFAATYWAANGGNWALAQYQIKEMLEAQEVAELTRPQRAPMLKANEENFLVPLAKAIESKDLKLFKRRFEEAKNGCMGCHTALGFGYIQFKLPKQSGHELLDFSLKTDPAH